MKQKTYTLKQLKAMSIQYILSVPDHPDPTKRSILKPKILEALKNKKAGTDPQRLLLNDDD